MWRRVPVNDLLNPFGDAILRNPTDTDKIKQARHDTALELSINVVS